MTEVEPWRLFFGSEEESWSLAPIREFYIREFLTYFPAGWVSPSVAVETERYAYAWTGGSAQRPEGMTVVDFALRAFYREEEEERGRLCEGLLRRARMTGMEGVPRRWWEDHPSYQEWWNRLFGNPEGHWPDGIYRAKTQRQEEEGK